MQVRTPAKVNLSLSLRGREPSGYHFLDSLVCFVDTYDYITMVKTEKESFSVSGKFAPMIDPKKNTVLNAFSVLRKLNPSIGNYSIHLEKNIPVGSGLGGGSSNAAGILRVFANKISGEALFRAAKLLGADVPVCVFGRPARVQGIGEKISPIKLQLASAPILLVTPNEHISTGKVFAKTQRMGMVSSSDRALVSSPQSWHNNLEPAAVEIFPAIKQIVHNLRRQVGVQAFGMSGSGGTCYAIFTSEEFRDVALSKIKSYPLPIWQEAHIISGKILSDSSIKR